MPLSVIRVDATPEERRTPKNPGATSECVMHGVHHVGGETSLMMWKATAIRSGVTSCQ